MGIDDPHTCRILAFAAYLTNGRQTECNFCRMLEPLFQMIYIIKRLQINLNKNYLVIFIVFHGIIFRLVLYNDSITAFTILSAVIKAISGWQSGNRYSTFTDATPVNKLY